MRKDGLVTRESILDSAHALVMESGYGGTTVDEVIQKAGLTKGAFFYHFRSKEDLARALVERFAKADCRTLDTLLTIADQTTDDPVQRLFAIVDQLIETLKANPQPEGCLYASYCYESGLLEEKTLKPVQNALVYWREKLSPRIRAALEHRPPKISVDPNELADHLQATLEGSFVLARVFKDSTINVRQLQQYRTYLAALFG